MARILYMSDLHLEMERWRLNVPRWKIFMARHRDAPRHPARGPMLDKVGKVDLAVLAGDVHNGFRGVVYADQLSRYLDAPVVLVAGNHEFYHHEMESLMAALRDAPLKTAGRVRFLENAAAGIDLPDGRLNVLGCTLWTDYRLHGTPEQSMIDAEQRMNDHRFIHLQGKRFTPEAALARHNQSREWLHENLRRLQTRPATERNLIVTHHAPTGGALGRRVGLIAPAYASNLLQEFAGLRLDGWIHGHTHHRHDSVEAGIRVVSAPRGYVTYDGDKALDFMPGIIDI